jgi:ATP-dependent DNA helicase PIF1
MVDATWFDCLEEIARRIRKIKKPFGGIQVGSFVRGDRSLLRRHQLVVCGDFFQLPPVPDHEVSNAPASFVFDAFTWDKCIKSRFALNQVFRQKDPSKHDSIFPCELSANTRLELIKLLNDARIGVVSPESARLLRSLARPVRYSDNIGPTEIYPVRYQADAANQRQLAALPGEPVTYSARDHHGKDGDGKTIPPERAAKLLGGMIVPRTLQLKVCPLPIMLDYMG